jgi:hypothetical protein
MKPDEVILTAKNMRKQETTRENQTVNPIRKKEKDTQVNADQLLLSEACVRRREGRISSWRYIDLMETALTSGLKGKADTHQSFKQAPPKGLPLSPTVRSTPLHDDAT